MANLRFNATRFETPGATRALAAAAVLSALALATTLSRADESKAPPLSASDRQEIGYLTGAWWMARGIHDFVWNDFDPNGIAVLLVERRPGRQKRALLTGHPAPPAGFSLVSAAKDDSPAIYGAADASLPAGAASPHLFAGQRTAVFFMGETVPDSAYGAAAAEQIIPRIIHEMAHVYAISKGMAPDLVPATPAVFTPTPEVMALAAVENRILAEFLFADSGKTLVLEELARQFVAVRRARWAMMGKAAEYEKKVEIFEAPAFFAQSMVLKLGAQKQIEPPPIQDSDPSYHSFQFGLLWRLDTLIGKLTDTPTAPDHLLARLPIEGAAQALMLERLGVEWREKVWKGEIALVDLLAGRVNMDPPQQEGALTAAKATYGYEPALGLARERGAAPASR